MTATLAGDEWSAARLCCTLLGGSQGRYGRAENLVPTGIRSRTIQPVVSRYTDWANRPTIVRSSPKNSNRKEAKSVSHPFCPGLPVSLTLCPIKQCGTLSYMVSVHGVRGGYIECGRSRGGFQCGEGVYPDNHAQHTIEILQLPSWPVWYFGRLKTCISLFSASNVRAVKLISQTLKDTRR